MGTWFILLISVSSCSNGNRLPQPVHEVNKPRDSAIRDGRTITMAPVGVTIELPQRWIDWTEHFHNNIHLTSIELEEVKNATTEWDKEYSQVINAIFAYEACVCHAGGEGWGENATSFADVQMRFYILDLSLDKVADEIASHGPRKALEVSSRVCIVRQSFDGWQRQSISFPLSFLDYGGTANIDAFRREVNGKAVVVVFMYSDQERENAVKEVESIVRSFKRRPK